MSLLADSDLRVNRVTRWAWGAQPRRVVRLVVRRTADTHSASVWGVESGVVTEIQHEEGVTFVNPNLVRLADGTEWRCVSVGCGCNVPPALKSFRPPQ